jgi:ribosomal protein L13
MLNERLTPNEFKQVVGEIVRGMLQSDRRKQWWRRFEELQAYVKGGGKLSDLPSSHSLEHYPFS